MGLFGIGKNQKLLKLQKVLVDNSPNRLVYTEKQLYSMANRTVQRELKIIQDCVELVNHTVKPDVFFSRYDLLKDKLAFLSKLQPYVDFKHNTPSATLSKIINQEQDEIQRFLIRYFTEMVSKAEEMKTEKGKKGKYKKFYDSLQQYTYRMNAFNRNYIESKRELGQ